MSRAASVSRDDFQAGITYYMRRDSPVDGICDEPPRGGGGGTWVNFCWVCAAGLSEPLPHYNLFLGQLLTPS